MFQSFFNFGARWGWVVIDMPQLHYSQERDPVRIVWEAGWDPGLVWTGAENFVPNGFNPWTMQPIVGRYTDYAVQPSV